MNSDAARKRQIWLIAGVGGFVIVVLIASLIGLIFLEPEGWPEDAVEVDNELVEGEARNRASLAKLSELTEREPGLLKLPLVVEYYTEDFGDYVKYVVSYDMDESEKGFFLILKDYTGVGMEVILDKLAEIGINAEGVETQYQDLSGDELNARAGE